MITQLQIAYNDNSAPLILTFTDSTLADQVTRAFRQRDFTVIITTLPITGSMTSAIKQGKNHFR